MENHHQPIEKTKFNASNSTLLKGFFVFILTLILLIPIPIILSIIEERSNYQKQVVNEISTKWSGEQVLYGPYLWMNYKVISENEKGEKIEINESKFISANSNAVKGKVNTSVKKRSLYETVVYHSDLNLQSVFPKYEQILEHLNIQNAQVLSTKLVFGIQDLKGMENRIILQSNGNNYELNSDDALQLEIDSENKNNNLTLLSTTIVPDAFNMQSFNMNIKLKGSKALQFMPSASETFVEITSDWSDHKFDGYALPIQSIQKDQLQTMQWKIFQEHPMKGQYWNGKVDQKNYQFGIEFLQLNDHYEKTYRSTKYAILFIGLTFVAFFFIENRNNFNIHLVQYALVGFAICVNFVLLLSISEYLGFDWAFIISSTATIALITYFVFGFLKSWNLTFKITGMLVILYSFIYCILQLKEHALLVGSIGLFFFLLVIMMYSRNIEWNSKK
ncbi:MAG TPA: cell envelope integrity protein CreD [Faecalibacter sp.]